MYLSSKRTIDLSRRGLTFLRSHRPYYRGVTKPSPVKELDWCAPNREKRASQWSLSQSKDCVDCSSFGNPPERFGIIAAISRNRVIGINGQVPWKIAEDRKYFEDVTRGKVLLLGRKSFEETPEASHLKHVRRCVVLSKTADDDSYDHEFVRIARSFQEALDIAQRFAEEDSIYEKEKGQNIILDCWVAGGERIYEEALKHPSAQELHLTRVDIDIKIVEDNGKALEFSQFPAKYRWDHQFKESKKWRGKESESIPYTFHVYERQRRKKL